jgi:hypothetical protein
MNRREIKQAAATIGRILEAVRNGTLDASGPVSGAIVRRLEGAQVALESIVRPRLAKVKRKPARSK